MRTTKPETFTDAALFRARRQHPAIGYAISAVMHGIAAILLFRAPAVFAVMLCAIVAVGIVFQPEAKGKEVR